MRRRDLALALCAAGLGMPRIGNAQARVPHLLYLWLGGAGSDGATRSGLQAGLRGIGYRDGENIRIDERYADGNEKRLADLAAVAVAEHPDLIVAPGSVVTASIAKLTNTIPIVSVSGDPVGLGFVGSLAHPGGNITGLTVQVGPELAQKWLELLGEIVPGARRIAMLVNGASPMFRGELIQMRAAGSRQNNGTTINEYPVRDISDLPTAFSAMHSAKPDALVVDNDPLLIANAAMIVTNTPGLPAICGNREFVTAGGLMSYGASIPDIYRRAATYIDRILKGAKPADLPIEQPTKFELVINLKTAKALGLTVPPPLLAQADEVIE
jgi:putative ABC transport system substrate-binding protein